MCLLCEAETEKSMICNNCLDYLPVANPPLCTFCGRPTHKGNICTQCKKERAIDHGRAWMLFVPPTDKLIHHFKYRGKSRLATLMGRAMASIIKSDHTMAQADAITPVPLYWWKKLRRGYDQSSLLAHIISQNTGIDEKNTLRRVRNTRTQTRLSDHEREKNVRRAFNLNKNGIKGKKVILVDDVLTTGATINECARVLKEAGAAAVYSCVAAITP